MIRVRKVRNLFNLLAVALIILSLGACGSDDPKVRASEYGADVTLTSLTGVTVDNSTISLTVYNQVYQLLMVFGTTAEELPAGTYTYTTAKTPANGNVAITFGANGREIKLNTDTKVEVTHSADVYDITMVGTTQGGDRVRMRYTGEIKFRPEIIPVEPSGYSIMISEGDVVDSSSNVVSGVTKYSIMIIDQKGEQVGQIDAVNKSGLNIDALVGTYTMTSYPTQPWQADNGWVVYYPGVYEMSGGSYFVDQTGEARYITKGDVVIEAAQDKDGNKLYNFTGEDLETLTGTNAASKGLSFNNLGVKFIEGTGTLLRDQTIPSALMGGDQLYTVYLPKDWSKDNANGYPVLYMLHGATNGGATGHNDWTTDFRFDMRLSAAIATGNAPEMVVIFPNCCVNGQNLFYCDNYEGGDYPYMSYFFNEFLPELEKKYNVRGDRKGRMIAGLSMGGYGSLYYGSLHPEMFSYVYACSPATWLNGAPNIFDLYGNAFASGTELPGITIEIGTWDFLFSSAEMLKGYFDGVGIPCEYITRDGAHDWKFWSACGPKIIAKAASIF